MISYKLGNFQMDLPSVVSKLSLATKSVLRGFAKVTRFDGGRTRRMERAMSPLFLLLSRLTNCFLCPYNGMVMGHGGGCVSIHGAGL
jgi:hypothetical protein